MGSLHIAFVEPCFRCLASFSNRLEEPAIQTSVSKDVPRIEEDLKSISPRAAELYGDLAHAVQTGAASLASRGLGPEKVAEAIELALTAKRPKPEVIIGNDAKYLMRPLGLLPTRIREAVSAALFKLP
jgi:hypothetical protein